MSKFKLMVIALLSVVTAAACAQTGRVVESERSVASISETGAQLSAAQEKLSQISVSIDDLSSSRNMQAAFQAYSKDVSDVQADRQRIKAQREAMRASNRSYIAKWQKEIDTIQSEDVRSALEKRKEIVSDNFSEIRASLDQLSEAYQPFLINILEIRRALALDLNQSGIESLKPAMDKAKDQAQAVKEKITDVRQKIDEVTGSMSPTNEMK
jgi:predicted  nucleic acid-binding Zn-ribbon protein